jgi:predicted MFS family arabinose efflux permease
MPDYPATNPISVRTMVKNYPKMLWSIVTLYPKHAVLVQSALLAFCTFFAVTSYWTTLTFLLAGSPYHYNPLEVGLFGLIGVSTMVLAPIYSKCFIQPLREPLFSIIIGKTITLVGTVIGTYTGRHSVVGPVIQALMLDAGLVIVQISNRLAIHPVEPLGRNRVNTAFVSVLYLGQLTGTKAGNVVYEKYGGWIASGSLSVAMIGFSFVIIALRGPHEQGWFGWHGGWGVKPKEKENDAEEACNVTQDSSAELKRMPTRERAASVTIGVDGLSPLAAQISRS